MFGRFVGLRSRIKTRSERKELELTPENSNLTSIQIATAKKALHILGMEPRSGELTKQDFIVFLYAMGLNPTEDIIDSKIRAFKLHHRRTFSFGQLAHVWYSMLQDLIDEDEILRRAFQFFDKDGNGVISVQELKTTMHELGDLLTEEEIAAFMTILDVNQDGAIEYTEFLATLKTQAPELVGDTDQQEPTPEHADGHSAGMLTRAGARHYVGRPVQPSVPGPGASQQQEPAEPLPLRSPSIPEAQIPCAQDGASGTGTDGSTGQPAGPSSPRRRASLQPDAATPTASETPTATVQTPLEPPPLPDAPPLLAVPSICRRSSLPQQASPGSASTGPAVEAKGVDGGSPQQQAEQAGPQEDASVGSGPRVPAVLEPGIESENRGSLERFGTLPPLRR